MLYLIPVGIILLLGCIMCDYNEHIKNRRRWEKEKDEWIREQLERDQRIKKLVESCREDVINIRNSIIKKNE